MRADLATKRAEAPEVPKESALPDRASAIIRRQRIVLAVAIVAALGSTGGLVASSLVKSPAQIAAESRAPQATLLSTTVVKQVLTNPVTTRGSVAASAQFQITPPATTQGAMLQTVTGVHIKVGSQVAAGDVLVEVSGRPVIALGGAVPLYRDLKPNADGDDVAQLQEALRSLHFYDGGDPRGHFGPATKASVVKLYQHLGFDVPTTGGPNDDGDRQALSAAQAAVDAAQRSVDDLQRQITAQTAPSAGTAASAGAAPGVAPGAAPASGAEPLPVQMGYLTKALKKAKQDQADLQARTGPMVPAAEAVFLPAFPAQITQFASKVGDQVKAPLFTVASGQLEVGAQLSSADGSLLKPGMKVQIVAEALGLSATGTVGTVGTLTTATATSTSTDSGGTTSGAPYIPVTVVPDAPLAAQWAGQDVRLVITAASTPGEVLTVPISAVSSGADGKTTVSRLAAPAGTITRVEVTAGISGQGLVAVTPLVPTALEPGDKVVVSAQGAGSSGQQ